MDRINQTFGQAVLQSTAAWQALECALKMWLHAQHHA